MARITEIVAEMRRNPKGIRFSDLCNVCNFYFGEPRQSGSSHHVYKTPWQGDPVSTSKMIRGQRKPIRSNKFCEQSIDWRPNVTLKNDRYTYRVTWSEEDEEYIGLCLEFPSLSWLAATPETALEGIRGVVAEVVTEMQANGETPPTPFAIKQYSGRFMVRIPPDEHRRLALEAAEAGISLNRLVSAKLGQ